mmetsp:Transcript_1697/g.3502  ORF Transcript_1697/g.3502 Transcript_1697/m.3502 type:complete len:81 (+) Transcript_1697:42-284(+)
MPLRSRSRSRGGTGCCDWSGDGSWHGDGGGGCIWLARSLLFGASFSILPETTFSRGGAVVVELRGEGLRGEPVDQARQVS